MVSDDSFSGGLQRFLAMCRRSKSADSRFPLSVATLIK